MLRTSISFEFGRAALLSLLLGVGLIGCMSAGSPGPSASPAAAPSGLPDGINESFLAEDLDVDEYVDRFEGESRAVFAQRRAIVEALTLSPGDAVADIGAGTGFFSFLFAEDLDSTGRVYAVEISPRFLDYLRNRKEKEGAKTLQVVEGSARSVNLPDASVDLAFICDVYHHFEYPADSLASLYSAIRPGGSLILIDFKRVPGKSPEWLLKHVRAGQDVFQAEIAAAGFVFDREIYLDGLEDNYILRFDRLE